MPMILCGNKEGITAVDLSQSGLRGHNDVGEEIKDAVLLNMTREESTVLIIASDIEIFKIRLQ